MNRVMFILSALRHKYILYCVQMIWNITRLPLLWIYTR